MPTNDRIIIEGLEFYAFHGASDAEQTVGHRYIADVELTIDTRAAGHSDALADTVSYADVARRIVEVGASRRFRLIEALNAALIETLFAEFPLVQSVQLRICKIAPPMNAIVARVGVETTRTRSELATSETAKT